MLLEGLAYMAVGILIVFLFLVIMVLTMRGVKLLSGLLPQGKQDAKPSDKTRQGPGIQETAAAAAAAYKAMRRSRDRKDQIG